MAAKSPLGKIKDTAIGALTDPVGTAGKVVEQAKGTAALGRLVAEQVGRAALAKAAEVAGRGRTTDAPGAEPPANLRAVPEVNEPAHTAEPVAVRQDEPVKKHGDAVARGVNEVAAKKVAKKAAKKAPAKMAPANREDADQEVPTPADVAKVVKKAPAKKASGPSSPGDKLPPRKKAAKKRPKTAEQLRDNEGGVTTPAGTTGAGAGRNPDTAEADLHQPGTAPLMDPATVKAVASESEMLRKAADPDKG